MSKLNQNSPQPHPVIAMFAIGSMALGLAAGMVLLGLMQRIDLALESFFLPAGLAAPTQSLPSVLLWICAALVSFLLPCIILNIIGLWRRLIIFVASTGITLAWGPVLLLASYRPELGLCLIAALWSGLCAIIYAQSHEAPNEEIFPITQENEHGAS
jgi:hypothetical protein